MRSFSYYFHRCLQRGIVAAAYGSFPDRASIIAYETLEVFGEPDDRTKVVAACDWLKSVSPNAGDLIAQYVRRVIVTKLGDNAFLPIEKTIVLIGRWLNASDIQAIARMIAKGAKYIRDCEVHGKHKGWGQKAIPGHEGHDWTFGDGIR